MRQQFATTRNVRAFYAGMEQVQPGAAGGKAEMALVHGVFGTGKTETAQRWAAETGAPYIRVLSHMTARSLLAAIVAELGEAPRGRADALFAQAVDRLLERPQTLVVDEVDYLLGGKGTHAIEVLRDLYDCTNCPVVLVGMNPGIDGKIKSKLPHLADRWGAVVRFESFGPKDVAEIAGQLCEVAITEAASAWLAEHSGGRFRPLTRYLRGIERAARVSGVERVDVEHLTAMHRRGNGRRDPQGGRR